MSIINLLRGLRNDVGRRICSRRRSRRGRGLKGSASRRYSRGFGVETLEDRMLLTAYLVDTLADDPSAGDVTDFRISLREAITAANTNAAFGDAPAGQGDGTVDTITFDASLTGQTIVLGGVELAVSDDLSLTGLGAVDLRSAATRPAGCSGLNRTSR
jgi:hypothetical protein